MPSGGRTQAHAEEGQVPPSPVPTSLYMFHTRGFTTPASLPCVLCRTACRVWRLACTGVVGARVRVRVLA